MLKNRIPVPSGFEKATSALTIGNTIWLAAMTLYLYRSLTAIKAGLTRQAEIQQNVIKQLKDIRDKVDKIGPAIKAIQELDDAVAELESKANEGSSFDSIDIFSEQFELIIQALQGENIEVENVIASFQSGPGERATTSQSKSSSRRRRPSGRPRPETQNSKSVTKTDTPPPPPPEIKPVSRHRRPPPPTSQVETVVTKTITRAKPLPPHIPDDPGMASHTEPESEFDAEAVVAKVRSTASGTGGSSRRRRGGS